jgi:Fungal specific transcription factor domain
VSEEIKSKDITSPFLDACLYLFFARFNPTFPIMHEATFLLKDCGPFLLLNMVAIGSLFVGTSDAVGKVFRAAIDL